MLSQRARVAIIAVCGAAAAFYFGGGYEAVMGTGGSTDPETAIPKTSFLAASVNVAELRRSPIYRVLFSETAETSVLDKKALGIARLGAACGFDPLERVESLSVAVPEDGEKGDLGVAAKVDVTPDELEKCTTALAEGHGQKSDVKRQNGFGVIEASGAKLAYGHGGLLLAGKGGWMDTMIATAANKSPTYREAEAHVAIRKHLAALDGVAAPTMTVSALLPRSLRDRIRSEMAGEANNDPAQSVMAGVLGVSGVGAALKAGASGGSINLGAVFVCDSDQACESVEKILARKRFEWSKELMLRMVGLGPLLDSISIKRDGSRITVTASGAADQLSSVADRVLRYRARRGERAEPRPEKDQPHPRPKPDEQIPAKP